MTNRTRQRVDDPMRDGLGFGQAEVVVEQDRELVATEPGGDVVCAQDGPQPGRDIGQEPVSRGMPEGVVDDLEVVEVEEQHRAGILSATPRQAIGDRSRKRVRFGRPVRGS